MLLYADVINVSLTLIPFIMIQDPLTNQNLSLNQFFLTQIFNQFHNPSLKILNQTNQPLGNRLKSILYASIPFKIHYFIPPLIIIIIIITITIILHIH
jgi:hypothetical protein